MADEILQEFLAESWENLSQLDSEILQLEKNPGEKTLLDSIFRTIHTIKGTCGFIGLKRLGEVAHAAENVLGQMRNGRLAVSSEAVSIILEAVDRIKELLTGLEATDQEPELDSSGLIHKLELLESLAGTPGGAAPPPSNDPPVETEAVVPPASVDEVSTPTEPVPEPEDAAEPSGESDTTSDVPPAPSPEPVAAVDAPKQTAEAANEAGGQKGTRKGIADLSIRVNIDVLDILMNLVGELVLSRNQLLQILRGDEESIYSNPINHLNRITTDLQEGVMKTRMQPIGNAWNKLPRLVRDLSQMTGKQLELEMTGAETELDRTVLDAIKDPLTHIVRNSADHGIELPEQRRATGKSEVGHIRLKSFHHDGHVVICVEDDGAGINVDKVTEKAVQRGLISDTDVVKMSRKELLQFIFHPGLSTAAQVSSISGRGVGMDVVKTEIEKIGGTVELNSEVGVGTTIKIKIPLTLAIISALVVESGGESFAIPQLGVVELVRLAAEDKQQIERIHDKQVFRLRDRLLPLVRLNEVMDLPEESGHDEDQDINIVVVQVGEEQLGLVVAQVFDTEEIVVKPVGRLLKNINLYQGTTILGDGRVIMILDVAGIAARFGGTHQLSKESSRQVDEDSETADDVTSLLLFGAGSDGTMSVPLSLVARLEEIPQDQIEETADKLVVQYRDNLLPLLPINGFSRTADAPDPQPVIVFSEGRNSMGLMVEEIQDILEVPLRIQMQSRQAGIMGSAIIDGHATDIIDTQHYIMQANPEWFCQNEQTAARHVLIVDDSIFFRQMVMTALDAEGHRGTAVASATRAKELIEHGEHFDLIVSDLHMPEFDGFEFAKWLRSRPTGNGTPLVALTGVSRSIAEQRALEAGFDRFLVKFESRQLIQAIDELCAAPGLEKELTA